MPKIPPTALEDTGVMIFYTKNDIFPSLLKNKLKMSPMRE